MSATMTCWRTESQQAWWQSTSHYCRTAPSASRSSLCCAMASAVIQTLSLTTCPWWRAWSSTTSWRLSNVNCTSLRILCWGRRWVCLSFNLRLTKALYHCHNCLLVSLHHLLCRYVLGYKGNASQQSVESRGPRESGVKVVHVVTTSCSTIQLQSLLNAKLLPLCSSGETEIQVSAAVLVLQYEQG